MLIKGRFIEVLDVRPIIARNAAVSAPERYAVEYLIEEPYTRRDGSVGSQQFIAEAFYDQQPALVKGPVTDQTMYEFELFFKVRTSQDGRKWQSIVITKASTSII